MKHQWSVLWVLPILFLGLLLLTGASAIARPVNPEKAIQAAQTLWQQRIGENLTQWSVNDTSFQHIYCLQNERGGVVFLAKDDCVHPVVGYSAEGIQFPIPENAAAWLKDRDREIEFCIVNGLQASKNITVEWEILVEGLEMFNGVSVAPMVQTKWNQSPRYNNLCPPDTGNRSVTGCVATATAQVMRYWNYPATGTGSHCYTHTNYGQLCANFGQTTYDWANMPIQLNANSSNAQVQAVATLCYHCGVAVEMDYDPSGSGASTYDVASALTTYFGYKNTAAYTSRSSFSTDAAWVNALVNELNHGRPMVYRGSDANNGGGHSFVCDGYDASNYLHFNWGWGGSMDGYYTTYSMNPGSYAFTVSQAAVMGIQPNTGFNVSPTNFTISSSNETVSFDVQSISGGGNWTVTSNDSWIMTVPSSGTGNGLVQNVVVMATANSSNSPRTGTITVTQGSHQAVVTIVQEGYCPVQTLPFFEGFESSSSLPTCWSEQTVVGSHNWVFQAGGTSSQPHYAHNGSRNAAFLHSTSGSSTRLITPVIDLSSALCPYLNFYMANADWTGDVDELRVYYRNSNTGTWTELDHQEEAHASWTLMSYYLPNPSSQYQIAFEATDHYGYGMVIDDIRIFDSIGGVPPIVEEPAESVITIGMGISSNNNAPYNNFYKNSWNECRYQGSEIGQPCVISRIAYEVASANTLLLDTVRVYMGITNNATFSNTANWTPMEDLTLVYEGTGVTIGAATGWEPIRLDRPFLFTDTNKTLVVVVAKKASTYTSSLRYYYSSVNSSVLYRQSDSQSSYGDHPNGESGNGMALRPNIQLTALRLPSLGGGGTDTVIVNHYIHDTTIVTIPVHDTLMLTQVVYLHDTTIVTLPVHDTLIQTQVVYLHDTTFVPQYYYDTVLLTLHDTVEVPMPIDYRQLTVQSANISQGLAAGNGQFPMGTDVEIAAIPLEGYRFKQWTDGNTQNPRIVHLSADASFTAQFEVSSVGIAQLNASEIYVTTQNEYITIRGAQGQMIRIFDAIGRQLYCELCESEAKTFRAPVSGAYLVQCGTLPVKKVVVVK